MQRSILTRRLRLRMYQQSDLEAFANLLADEQVNALTGNGVYGREEASRLLKKPYSSTLRATRSDILRYGPLSEMENMPVMSS